MAKKLFLDANILLDLYRFGKDDIEELQKLIALIDEKEIEFVSNEILKQEVLRARDAVVSATFGEFASLKFQAKLPPFLQGHDEVKPFLDTLKEANAAHSEIVKSVRASINARTLAADALIGQLFDRAHWLDLTEEVYRRASHRTNINNPPRKTKDSAADSIHWESLLAMQSGFLFHMVTRDGDFASELEPQRIKTYLFDEWKANFAGLGKITLHTTLGGFFRENFPEVKLSALSELNAHIERLAASPNFSTTHAIIGDLENYSFFTARQAQHLLTILVTNNQVRWIATDADIKDFFCGLKEFANFLPDDLEHEVTQVLEVERDFFFPF